MVRRGRARRLGCVPSGSALMIPRFNHAALGAALALLRTLQSRRPVKSCESAEIAAQIPAKEGYRYVRRDSPRVVAGRLRTRRRRRREMPVIKFPRRPDGLRCASVVVLDVGASRRLANRFVQPRFVVPFTQIAARRTRSETAGGDAAARSNQAYMEFLIREAFGRNSTEPPTEPVPAYGCGDLNGDGWVDEDDLVLFYEIYPGSEVPCPLLDCIPLTACPCVGDFNFDALINADDEAILLDHLGTYLFDLDGNGCFDANDLNVFLAFDFACSGDPTYNPAGDFNCDGCVDAADLTKILAHVPNPPCP